MPAAQKMPSNTNITLYCTLTRENTMKNNKVRNKLKEIGGHAKEVVGKITGDKQLEVEGNVQKNVSKINASYNDIKDSIKESRDD